LIKVYVNSLKEGRINNSRAEILVDVSGKQTPVPVVSHMSSIVDPSDEELKSVPGDFLILIQIKTQKILTHLKDREMSDYCKHNRTDFND